MGELNTNLALEVSTPHEDLRFSNKGRNLYVPNVSYMHKDWHYSSSRISDFIESFEFLLKVGKML